LGNNPKDNDSCHSRGLKRKRHLVWAFDLVFGLQEFFTPWFACTLGAVVNGVADSETVITGPFRAGSMEPFTRLAWFEELAFECPVLAP
jgi:hypothetical protein